MSYECIVLDLDGTLTNSEKQISKRNKEALFRIQEKGKKVVLASGRPTPGIVKLAEELELQKYGGYMMAYNGAKITNCKTEEVVFNATLPEDAIPGLYQIAKQVDVGIVTYKKDGIVSGNGKDEYLELESRINSLPILEVEDFVQEITWPINKCLMSGEPDKILHALELAKGKFKSKLNIFRSEPFFLECVPNGVDKASGLAYLLKDLHLEKEQLICCGDGFNDLSMIQFAGLGVAMANAQEDVRKAADYITLSNDEDGVAAVIEKFMED